MYLIYSILILLLILPVFQSYMLTWRELVRIFIILVTLSVLYSKFYPSYKKSLRNLPRFNALLINPHNKKFVDAFCLITSFIFIFIVSQFNPSTASFASFATDNPPPDINWFFVASTILILVGFVSLVRHLDLFRENNSNSIKSVRFRYRKIDGFVLILVSVIISIGFLSNLLLSENPQWSAFFFSVLRILVFVLIWFFVSLLFVTKVNGKNFLSFFSPMWVRRSFIVLSLSFSVILIIGVVRFVDVYSLYAKSNKSFQNGDFDASLVSSESVLEKNLFLDFKPITDSALENLASIYSRNDSTAKFNTTINLIIENNKGNERINSKLGRIYFNAGKNDQAKKEFEEFFIRRQMYDETSLKMLGKIYLKENNLSGLIEIIDTHGYNPNKTTLAENEHVLMGNAFFELERFDDAAGSYTNTLGLNAENSYAYYKLGRAQFEKGNYEIAIEQFSRAIDIDSTFADAYYQWGLSLEKLDKKDDALKKFKMTVAILPNHFNGLTKLKELGEIK